MKCVVCKQGETKEGVTTVTLTRGNTTAVFKEVPAAVCENCGEAYVDEEVTKELLKEAEEIAGENVQVDVRTYRAA